MTPPGLTPRLRRRAERDGWAHPEAVLEAFWLQLEQSLDGWPVAAQERMLAAVVLGARGDVHRARQLCDLGLTDWRDLLVAGGVADGGWPAVLDAELGPQVDEASGPPWWGRLLHREG